MPTASDIIQQASSRQSTIYENAETVAQHFIANAGTLYPAREAISQAQSAVATDLTGQQAQDILAHLAEDRVDPVSAVHTQDGLYFGVIDYQEQDFYYETTIYHDLIGETTMGVCSACVNQHAYDSQAVSRPAIDDHLQQVHTNAVVPGESGSQLNVGETPQERRNALGKHYVNDHTTLTPLDVGRSASGKSGHKIAEEHGVDPTKPTDVINQQFSVGEMWDEYGATILGLQQDHDLGIGDVQVGASLVSGTTIGGNTALHGGNLGSFNVENFGTAGASGEVPTSDGAGNLTMEAPGGGGTFTEDANSPLTISGSDSGSITLDGTYDVIRCIFISDSSSTTGNGIDLQVNGVTTGYETRLSGGGQSADSFIKRVFLSGYSVGTEIMMAGSWDTNWALGIDGGECPTVNNTATKGANTSITSPVDSITLLDDAANNFSVTVRVEGIPV